MRPIISPAMKTARIANTSMPYRPAPTPPNTTSPSWISSSGTAPPSGVNESCIAFTAPQDAAVVMVANSAEAAMPKRASLPSMLPPGCSALATGSTPSAASCGWPCCSRLVTATTASTNITVIAASNAPPWRTSPTMRPNANTRPAGIRKIASICAKFDSGVGFS